MSRLKFGKHQLEPQDYPSDGARRVEDVNDLFLFGGSIGALYETLAACHDAVTNTNFLDNMETGGIIVGVAALALAIGDTIEHRLVRSSE
jgi:hypothetical protein